MDASELDDATRLPDEDRASCHRRRCQSLLREDCLDTSNLVDQLLDLLADVRLAPPQTATADEDLPAPGLAVKDHHSTRTHHYVVEVGAAGAGPVPAMQGPPAVGLKRGEEVAHDLLAVLAVLEVERSPSSFLGGLQVRVHQAALAIRFLGQPCHSGVLGRRTVHLITASE